MDLQATGANPGTEYLPSAGPPTPPYNEDRQVTLTGGPTQVYRTYNATFDAPNQKWIVVDSTKPAYANVQSPDGSIHYYTLNTANGLWEGSGNNAVYNAVDFGLVQGANRSAAQRAANVAAIQSAIATAIAKIPGKANGGGTVVIPAGIYELGGTLSPAMTATILIQSVTGGLTIRGESAGTTLIQYGTPQGGTLPNEAADIFDITNSGNPGQVGIRFREITFQYGQGLSLPSGGACAINCMAGSADVSAEQCGFVDCPQAFSAGGASMGGLQCGLIHSSILLGTSTYTVVYASRPRWSRSIRRVLRVLHGFGPARVHSHQGRERRCKLSYRRLPHRGLFQRNCSGQRHHTYAY